MKKSSVDFLYQPIYNEPPFLQHEDALDLECSAPRHKFSTGRFFDTSTHGAEPIHTSVVVTRHRRSSAGRKEARA
ncbi:Hypothetical predicted protein [Cloeon dipterum]|uniref:Uncharacterized protein n=1 Tax=Cloeon dipterum TaxID=197152 RepID=A0A8S1CV91_9INSE|nr:Hypothetical predicted protein [Cloeon dipterum]